METPLRAATFRLRTHCLASARPAATASRRASGPGVLPQTPGSLPSGPGHAPRTLGDPGPALRTRTRGRGQPPPGCPGPRRKFAPRLLPAPHVAGGENPRRRQRPGIPSGMTAGKGMAEGPPGTRPRPRPLRRGLGRAKGAETREAKNTASTSGLGRRGEESPELSFQKNKRGRETRGCESRWAGRARVHAARVCSSRLPASVVLAGCCRATAVCQLQCAQGRRGVCVCVCVLAACARACVRACVVPVCKQLGSQVWGRACELCPGFPWNRIL